MNRLASYASAVYGRTFDLGDAESGQGMVEYSLIIALVTLIVIAVVLIIGNQTFNMWCDIQGTMKNATG